MKSDSNTQRPVLLVEDESDYAYLVEESFREAELMNPFYRVSTAQEAIDYLGGNGKFSNRAAFPLPALMLLDIRLQDSSGFDVLRWLSERPMIKRSLQIVALSSIDSPNEVKLAYDLGVQLYIEKPDLDGLKEKALYLKTSWLSVAA